MAPALAAGCTVVLKPASLTPLAALAIHDLLLRAGLGRRRHRRHHHGLVRTVGAWLSDDRVRKVSFTGSTGVGRRLLRSAADRIVNASMELGGNAAFVVTDDADLDAAVDGAMIAKFRGSGQACTAANRFFVHGDVHDEFVRRFVARSRH